MSTAPHHTKHSEHGTLISYIVGFVLSLLFTADAYYLVVSKALTGNSLFITILGLGVMQMAVQIFFFLHLGRGPKPLYNVIFFVGTAGLILVVVVGSIFIMDNLQYNMTPLEVTKKLSQDEGISQINGEDTGACKNLGENHKVTFSSGTITPVTTDAKLCDTITFINEDTEARDISFRAHPVKDSYAGQEARVTNRRPKTITLNEAGSYLFHDHLDPGAVGYFTVSR